MAIKNIKWEIRFNESDRKIELILKYTLSHNWKLEIKVSDSELENKLEKEFQNVSTIKKSEEFIDAFEIETKDGENIIYRIIPDLHYYDLREIE